MSAEIVPTSRRLQKDQRLPDLLVVVKVHIAILEEEVADTTPLIITSAGRAAADTYAPT